MKTICIFIDNPPASFAYCESAVSTKRTYIGIGRNGRERTVASFWANDIVGIWADFDWNKPYFCGFQVEFK